MRALHAATVLTSLILAIAGCADDPSPSVAPAPSEGEGEGEGEGPSPIPDCGECADEPDEDCGACLANVGRCCYDDPAVLGQAAMVELMCRRDPGCERCCNECAALPCERLTCPNRMPGSVR